MVEMGGGVSVFILFVLFWVDKYIPLERNKRKEKEKVPE
jgi:hypothetical protein